MARNCGHNQDYYTAEVDTSQWSTDGYAWNEGPVVDGNTHVNSWRDFGTGVELFFARNFDHSYDHFVGALRDPDNIADVAEVAVYFPNKATAMSLLERARKIGRIYLRWGLGADCFEEGAPYYGKLDSVSGTQCYLKTLLAMAWVAIDGGDINKGIDASSESLRLCHEDRLGQRHLLTTLLLKAGRYSEALRLCEYWLDPGYDMAHPSVRTRWFETRPSLEPLDVSIVEYQKAETGAVCELLNAALAAFRMIGDCELARQCLRVATEVNPLIMMKILTRFKRPRKPYYRTRDINQREDAHDYRWLAQDLWEQMDVWEWALNDEEVFRLIRRVCTHDDCDISEATPLEFKQCSGCKRAFYCSYECQRDHWRDHRVVCQATREYFRKRDKPAYRFLGISQPAKVDLDTIGEQFDDWF